MVNFRREIILINSCVWNQPVWECVVIELTNVEDVFTVGRASGAPLQCSCPSYRAAERELVVGPGGERRSHLIS